MPPACRAAAMVGWRPKAAPTSAVSVFARLRRVSPCPLRGGAQVPALPTEDRPSHLLVGRPPVGRRGRFRSAPSVGADTIRQRRTHRISHSPGRNRTAPTVGATFAAPTVLDARRYFGDLPASTPAASGRRGRRPLRSRTARLPPFRRGWRPRQPAQGRPIGAPSPGEIAPAPTVGATFGRPLVGLRQGSAGGRRPPLRQP